MEQKNSKNDLNAKNGFEPKNFLFVSIDALIADIAWYVVKEGHNVKLFIENPEDKEVADGFVPKIDDWEKEVDWADVIIFDDVLGHGTKAKKLRDKGKLVIGGTPYTDMLEDDRAFGQEELKKHGVPILPYRDFTSFEEAIEFVKANPGQYVIKPSGEAQNIKGLLFIGEEDDGKDVIQVLSDYNKAWAKKIPLFQLQKRVNGVEIAVGAFFNGKEFITPINVNFEHKKLFPGNLGPSTGEMGCYDEETEVLTEKKWKFFRELNYEDKICTLNPENDMIEFNAPEEIVVFDHHKKLISIKNQTLDLMVTPDHNMYVSGQWNARNKKNSFNFVKARDLEYQSVIKRTGNWIGIEQEYFILASVQLGHYEGRQVVLHESGEIKVLMDDWLAFMGIFIAEGSISNDTVNIAQSRKKESYNKIKFLFEKLDFKFSETDSGFNIYGKQLSSYLSVFRKAPEKFVPEFVKSLSPRQISVFLEWFALGDATQMKGYRIFYTSSKRLADGIQELLLKIGRVGVIKKRKRNDKTWIVNHFADSSRIQFEVHERVKKLESWIDKRDIKKTEYKGKVYCATVKNHIMFVRRNGKPCWCGNTAMFWSVPNKIFNNTLKKFEQTLAKEKFVGYIDINCMVNNYGIYPLEFTSRFGYPTISIQEHGMISPIGQFLFDLAKGENPKLKVHNGFQIGVRIVVPPFPFDDPETFEVKSKDSVIFFKKGIEGVHIEDVKLVNGEWVVTGNSGVILIVCGSGSTMRQAQQQVYSKIKNIMVPHMYYRKDIGDRWFEDSDKLHNWGYLRET